MTEAELLEAMSSMVANSLAAYAIFLTLASSYVIAAQIGGKTLASSQVLLLTVLYSTAVLVMIFTLYGHVALSDALRIEQIERFPRGDEIKIALGPFSLVSNILIYVGTLKYMWDVRKKNAT